MEFEDRKGFRRLTPEQRRELATKAGRIAHEKGVAHEWDSEEAIAAGRKGGLEAQRRKRMRQNGLTK